MSSNRVLIRLYQDDINVLIEDVSATIDVLREHMRSHLVDSVYVEETAETMAAIALREKLVAQLRVHVVP